MKVDHVRASSHTSLFEAKPNAPQRVNPRAPTRFQKPICQPSTVGAGKYHLFWVSSMNSQLEMMKPVPPTTWEVDGSAQSSGHRPSRLTLAALVGIALLAKGEISTMGYRGQNSPGVANIYRSSQAVTRRLESEEGL